MADDGFKLDVDGALAERLKLAAADHDWVEDYARVAEYERTGESIDVDTWVREFREKLEQRLREKRK
jgi:hypothetical protein